MADTQSYLVKAAIGGGSCAIAGSLLNPVDVVSGSLLEISLL